MHDVIVAVLLMFGVGAVAIPAWADDACVGHKWDVGAERSLFAGSAAEMDAGHDAKSAPTVTASHLYRFKLVPQSEVVLAPSAAKDPPTTAQYAGVAVLRVPAAGSYRIALDGGFWIDLLSKGVLVPVEDFQGLHGCRAPRKIVQFAVPAAGSFLLQLSNSNHEFVAVAITPAPARHQ
jgi:hypothetical protein